MSIYSIANGILSKNKGSYRSTNYEVVLTPPPSLSIPGDSKDVSFLCNVAELPPFTINAIETRIHTVTNLMPNAKLYANQITLSFFVLNELAEKRFFDQWADSIFYPNNTIRYFDEYTTDLTINALQAGTNKVVYSLTMEKTYPRNIGPVGLGYSQVGDIPQVQVTFVYERWKANAS